MDFDKEHVFQALKPNTEKSTSVILAESKLPKFSGNTNNKSRVDARVFSEHVIGKERSLPMVLKSFDRFENAEGYADFWSELKSAEIPTIPTVRIIGENEVLISDLTTDGSTFFGKDNVFPSFDRFKDGKVNNMDKLFLNIDPEELKQRAQQIAEKANRSGVFLPYDDPFDILVHPDGRWEIIVLDLMRSKFSQIVEKNNAKCVDKLVEYISLMRNGLTGKGERPMVVA